MQPKQPAAHGKDLRWQSCLMLAAVVPCCAIVTLVFAGAAWTSSTRGALLISLGLALLVWLVRTATPAAALTGGLLTAVFTLAPLAQGFAGRSIFRSALPPLPALFVLTWAATRFGRSRKAQLHVAEGKRGRNAAQVTANLGIAGLAAAAALSHPLPGPFYAVMVVAAMAEATADTVASELGAVLGGSPLMLTTLQKVAPGTDGAISLVGTLAGIGAAVLVLLVAVSSLALSMRDAMCAGLAAIAGLFIDSLLGATLERNLERNLKRRGWLNNDAVNFLSTLAASLLAAFLTHP